MAPIIVKILDCGVRCQNIEARRITGAFCTLLNPDQYTAKPELGSLQHNQKGCEAAWQAVEWQETKTSESSQKGQSYFSK